MSALYDMEKKMLSIEMMRPSSLGLALILTGVISLAMGIVMTYYKSFFKGETEEVEAKIVSMKRSVSGDYPLICPHAEYSIGGKLIKGHYYMNILESQADFKVGDTVTIQVNLKHPKMFMIKSLEERLGRFKGNNNFWILTVIGGVTLLAGIAAVILKAKGLV